MNEGKINGLLLDLAGTIYSDDSPVKGALEAIRTLHRAEIPLLFVTNTTSKPRSAILKKLSKLGLELSAEEIFSAPFAARKVLEQAGHRRCHFLLKPPVLEDFPGFEATDDSPDAVVVGDIGDSFDYPSLNHAFELLMDGAEFYALAANRFFESGGRLKLDVGPFIAALEQATGRKAILTGKPSKTFFQSAAAMLRLDPGEIAVVGDDIESDVGGALDAGLQGVLVKTGKYRQTVARESTIKPTLIVNSIAELPELLGLD